MENQLIRELENTNPLLNLFLIKKGIRDKFLLELENIPILPHYATIHSNTDIMSAFSWGESIYGYEYWLMVHQEFEKFIKDLNNGVEKK